MKCSIITSFPDLYSPFLQTSLVGRARDTELVTVSLVNLLDYVASKERIDAPTFGPGPGMLIKPTVVEAAIGHAEKEGTAFRIFFSPQGTKLNSTVLRTIQQKVADRNNHLMLVTARYEGMDARVEEEYADMVISIGDYVLMGGDLPAMVLLESLFRFVPGVIGNEQSITQDSFAGPFVDYPEFTQPVVWHNKEVPAIIRSGNHGTIKQWRREAQAAKTVKQHFQWLRTYPLNGEDKALAARYIPAHYTVLMHSDVLLPHEGVGTTSVTSIDIHDGARSAHTYGIKNYCIVTPLLDQQTIVRTLLDFWHEGAGKEYNPHRHEALKDVLLMSAFDEVVAHIEQVEGKKPLVIATSAKEVSGVPMASYYDQERVWVHARPVLLVFGTGKGLSQSFLERCDYVLPPLVGFTEFNHLSVRAAMAIVFDRWLGINPVTRVG
ncbi:MAG: tRNA (guanosine(37)-N1)-methyltransferase TrmD [Candidatus Babeliales bacterium]